LWYELHVGQHSKVYDIVVAVDFFVRRFTVPAHTEIWPAPRQTVSTASPGARLAAHVLTSVCVSGAPFSRSSDIAATPAFSASSTALSSRASSNCFVDLIALARPVDAKLKIVGADFSPSPMSSAFAVGCCPLVRDNAGFVVLRTVHRFTTFVVVL
jgi:hypothetical protein